jgi:hypothetical protein
MKKMNYIKSYKIFESNRLFEESVSKPVKKFPTEPAVHLNYLEKILKEAGIDMYSNRDKSFFKFCFDKCSSKDSVVFPNRKDSEGWDDARYEKFIFGESVFLLPISYDSSNDAADADKSKKNFLDKMRDFAKQMGKDEDQFVKDAEKNVRFGPTSYEWANNYLKIIHDKLGQYYKDGKLRVWLPKDTDYDAWEGMDYPHKYNIVGDLDRPNGVYYLSNIEKYIDDKYGIKDDLFYKFIIDNEYIEGRYWERVWSLTTEYTSEGKGAKDKLKKSNFGKYGMEPTENILHMLNIIEKDFGDEISGTDYEGFPIYIDYYKEVGSKY